MRICIIMIRIGIWIGINMEIRMPIHNTSVNYCILLRNRVIILCFFLSCLDSQEQVPLMAVFLSLLLLLYLSVSNSCAHQQ